MLKRKIFYKGRKFKKKYLLFFFIVFVLIFTIYINKINQTKAFIIPINNSLYYIIPEDREGKKISNQDKKGLHLSYKLKEKFSIHKDSLINYSVQIMSSDNYFLVNDMKNNYLLFDPNLFNSNNLLISLFTSNFGDEYLLLYGDFKTRKEAEIYCLENMNFLKNCFIVNVQNLN